MKALWIILLAAALSVLFSFALVFLVMFATPGLETACLMGGSGCGKPDLLARAIISMVMAVVVGLPHGIYVGFISEIYLLIYFLIYKRIIISWRSLAVLSLLWAFLLSSWVGRTQNMSLTDSIQGPELMLLFTIIFTALFSPLFATKLLSRRLGWGSCN